MKKVGVILIILICLIISASVAKDVIIKNSVKGIASIATGLSLDIGELKTGIAKTYISINDLVILNPPHFNDRVMLDIPEIYIDYDLPSLLKKRIHLYNMRINLKELTVIKDKDGKTNLDYLKGLRQEGGDKEQKGRSKKGSFLIDDLNLKMGKVIYKDYSAGEEPIVSEYKVNIDSRYKNVRDAKEIIRIIIVKAVLNTAIGNLTDFRRFRDIGSDTIESGKDILEKTVTELKNIFEVPFKKK